ncbi:MAG: biotin--[acetyl-CoA-carboxylase] ligase [Bacteroidales bacterium]|nr:biotin--[acetyl-CoA-carboxylase] ligase [Bacteroidales bacterium]
MQFITGYEHFHLPETDSTNLQAHAIIALNGDQEKFLISTDFQSSGKGLEENEWVSQPGLNLLFSMALQPKWIAASKQFLITQAVSLGVIEVVKEYVESDSLRIKWPNDIYIGDRKLAGMLISNTISGSDLLWSVIGIGLNVNQVSFPARLPNPVSLALETGNTFNINILLEKLVYKIDQLLIKCRFVSTVESLQQLYLDRLYRYQQWAPYDYQEETIEARIAGVNEFGQLRLEMRNGKLIYCNYKEIIFL